MKTVAEAKLWFEKLESGGALYVWGMNGEIISDKTIKSAYSNFKSNTYDWEYYSGKLEAGKGRIGADCSGAFAPLAGSDNTAAGYYAGCIQKGKIGTIPADRPCMVFKRNSAGNIYHIGWYTPDDGTVAEMASSKLNFRRLTLNGAGWTDWGIPKFIDYSVPVPEVKLGWIQEDGGWRYYHPEGCVRNDWYKWEDKWYWFDGNGMMVANTWYMYKGEWYYLGSDGAMLAGQLLEIKGKWYYLDDTGAMATRPVTLTPDQDGSLQFPGLAK